MPARIHGAGGFQHNPSQEDPPPLDLGDLDVPEAEYNEDKVILIFG
jgi:hypothetical protein